MFQSAHREFGESALQIAKAISSQHQFAQRAAGLQGRESMRKSASIILDLVGEATAQRFTGMIEPLLPIAHSVDQLPAESARAGLDVPAKIDNVGHDQLRGRARRRRTQVGHEIGDGEIDLVPNRRNDRHCHVSNCARHYLFIELPQILHASAAASEDDEIDSCKIFAGTRQLSDRDRDFLGRARSLDAHGID